MPKDDLLTLTRFEIDNFMRIVHFELDTDGGVVEIAGANGNGKSAVLAAWDAMLAGAGAVPEKPVHAPAAGEPAVEKYRIKGTFSAHGKPEYVITVTGRDGGKPTLKVERADGGRIEGGAQTFLNDLTGCVPFDAMEFSRMKPADQRGKLMQLVGLDFSDLDARLSRLRKDREALASVVKRANGAADTATHHPDAPAEEVSVEKLTAELQEAQEAETAFARKEAAYKATKQRIETGKQVIADTQRQIEELNKKLAEARKLLAECEEQAAREKAEAEAVPEFDIDEIRKRLNQVGEINAKVRDNQQREKLIAEAKRVKAEYDEFTQQIAEAEESKRKKLADAEFPYPGLGISDDGVTLKGVPFEQGSQAERVLAGAAIFLGILKAQNRRIRMLKVQDGALLDSNSRQKLRDMVREAGGNGLLEVVEATEQTAIIMEAGESRKADTSPAGTGASGGNATSKKRRLIEA